MWCTPLVLDPPSLPAAARNFTDDQPLYPARHAELPLRRDARRRESAVLLYIRLFRRPRQPRCGVDAMRIPQLGAPSQHTHLCAACALAPRPHPRLDGRRQRCTATLRIACQPEAGSFLSLPTGVSWAKCAGRCLLALEALPTTLQRTLLDAVTRWVGLSSTVGGLASASEIKCPTVAQPIYSCTALGRFEAAGSPRRFVGRGTPCLDACACARQRRALNPAPDGPL